MKDPCYFCSNTGFEDWAEEQEKPCPKGCQLLEPMTDKQRMAYLRRLELTGARAHRKDFLCPPYRDIL